MGSLNRFWLSCLGHLAYFSQRLLSYLTFSSILFHSFLIMNVSDEGYPGKALLTLLKLNTCTCMYICYVKMSVDCCFSKLTL